MPPNTVRGRHFVGRERDGDIYLPWRVACIWVFSLLQTPFGIGKVRAKLERSGGADRMRALMKVLRDPPWEF